LAEKGDGEVKETKETSGTEETKATGETEALGGCADGGNLDGRHLRQEMLFGEGSTAILRRKHVAVFGIGGVGGYAVEALARGGVGRLTLVDKDTYSPTNLNRQLYATLSTLGMAKVEAARRRVLEIDPLIEVVSLQRFFLPETAAEIDFSAFDYVIDAVDTVSAKVALAVACRDAGVPLISCMGTGNKTDPTAFRVADLYKTTLCPLARAVRNGCRKAGVTRLKCVYSEEAPHRPPETLVDGESGKPIPASCAFVPAAAGLILAGEAVKDLLAEK
jgi:tRNA A37 threonylcarbamoyladenosine dehydratase